MKRAHLAHAVVVDHTERGTPVYAAQCGRCHWRGPLRKIMNLADMDAKRHEERAA